MFHQNARELVFPMTVERNIGTMLAFVVRNIFADANHLRTEIRRLVSEGRLPAELATKDNPLDFLIHEGGARTSPTPPIASHVTSPARMSCCSAPATPLICAAILRRSCRRRCRRPTMPR